jgi:hypothetical protein
VVVDVELVDAGLVGGAVVEVAGVVSDAGSGSDAAQALAATSSAMGMSRRRARRVLSIGGVCISRGRGGQLCIR